MLSALSTLSDSLGCTFLFGDRGSFTIEMDKVTDFPVIYSEGFGEGGFNVNDAGNVPIDHRLTLWVFGKQAFSAKPAERTEQIDALLLTGCKLIKQLARGHNVTGGSWLAATNVKATDRFVDGVRFTFTAVPRTQTPVPVC